MRAVPRRLPHGSNARRSHICVAALHHRIAARYNVADVMIRMHLR